MPPQMYPHVRSGGASRSRRVSPASSAIVAAAPAGRGRQQTRADQEPDGRHVLRRPASRRESRLLRSGSQVDEETDVCIIEAMKVFNTIKAECRGTIAKILVQDGQPVEFGTGAVPGEAELECRHVELRSVAERQLNLSGMHRSPCNWSN